ncbi:MAG: glycosyltransferase, partial [Bacteroidota bacterium]
MTILPPTLRIPIIVIGSGRAYERLVKTQISRRGLEPWFTFLPEADFQDFPELYKQALFSVYPSDYEGFGIPVVESLVSGTPVILTQASSLPEAGGGGGWYMEVITADALAAGMKELIENREKRDQLAEAGKQHVEKFRPGRLTEDLYGLYKEVSR